VATGYCHSLALTDEGELYEWGGWQYYEDAEDTLQRVPHRIAELVGQQVKLVYAVESSSCAVTEHGELYSWSIEPDFTNHLGHGRAGEAQTRPARVEGLGGVTVAAAAMCHTHTLVADEDGVVWGFGRGTALGLDCDSTGPLYVKHPTPIPALRVRVRKSPPVARL